MRRSSCTEAVPPSGRTARSWSTRSSLACVASGMSPISSRNSVPPLAAAKRPSRRRSAPVNAPFSWPNSSDSSRVSGTAAQFTARNRPPRRRARPVDGLRHELLAGAALPQQEHGGVALGHRADLAHRLLHDLRAPEDAVQPLLPLDLRAQPLVLAPQPVVVERAPHRHRDLGQLEGLRQVVVRALAHGLDRGLERAERGHEDDARRGSAAAGGGEHLEPADLVHDEIGDHHVELLGRERLQRRPPARRGHDRHVLALEVARQHGASCPHRRRRRGRAARSRQRLRTRGARRRTRRPAARAGSARGRWSRRDRG